MITVVLLLLGLIYYSFNKLQKNYSGFTLITRVQLEFYAENWSFIIRQYFLRGKYREQPLKIKLKVWFKISFYHLLYSYIEQEKIIKIILFPTQMK